MNISSDFKEVVLEGLIENGQKGDDDITGFELF